MSRRSLLVAAALVGCLANSLQAGNPVDIHGRLRAVGNRIVGEKSGDTVQLTGMSLFWHQWMGQYYNAKTVDWLVDDWRCSILRAAIGVNGEGNIDADSNTTYAQLDAVVQASTRRSVYVVVDYHAHYAIKNIPAAKAFFERVAKQYGQNPGVIFEIFNEPWDDVYSWSEIKAYSEEIIPVIRKHSPNLILVGTRQWSRDVDSAAMDPVSDTNSAYVLHFYSGSHRDSLRDKGRKALALGKALFVSEWGTTESEGGHTDKTVYTEESDKWFAWMDSNKISSCNWSVQNKDEAAAALKPGVTKLFGWDTSDLSPSGKYAKARIVERNTQYTFELPPIDSTMLPGRIQAEAFSAKSQLEVSPGAADDDSRRLMNSEPTSWAEYDVVIPFRKKGVIALRVGTGMDSAAPVVKINGKAVARIPFKNTGNWNTFVTVVSDSVILPAGSVKVRVDYNGQFDFDWLEITGRRTSESDPPQSDTVHQVVRIEAEDAVASKSLTKESSGDEDATGSMGYTTDSSWAEYKALLPQGRQIVAVRAASGSEGATLKISVNGAVKANVKVAGTGGWQTWKTVVAADSFDLDLSDSATVRVDWEEGNGQSSLVNLNWIEFRGPDKVIVGVRSPGAARGFRAHIAGSVMDVDFGTSFAGTLQVVDLHGRILAERKVSGESSARLVVPAWKGVAMVRAAGADGIRSIPVFRP